ncbi:MAG: hypothetical protein KDK08_09300 [Rhizobiaceae bacterium]|nr:hypothetical protein [Rhizobiaceae bacterium]
MHNFLFCETTIAPDIFFFISEYAHKLSTANTAEALLFRESIRLGALRPQFRRDASSFSGALKTIESAATPQNRIEGPEIDRQSIARALDAVFVSDTFDNWPTTPAADLFRTYQAWQDNISSALENVAPEGLGSRYDHSFQDLIDKAREISRQRRQSDTDIRRGELFRLIAAAIDPSFSEMPNLPAPSQILDRASTPEARHLVESQIAIINSLYFLHQSSMLNSVMALRPTVPYQERLLAPAPKTERIDDDTSASVAPFRLPNYDEMFKLDTKTLIEIRKSDEAKSYFSSIDDKSLSDANRRDRFNAYTNHICRVAMVKSGLAAREWLLLYASRKKTDIVLDLTRTSYGTAERFGKYGAAGAGAVRYAVEGVQSAWLKNRPNLQKRIENAVLAKHPEFFSAIDEKFIPYDQVTVDGRELIGGETNSVASGRNQSTRTLKHDGE